MPSEESRALRKDSRSRLGSSGSDGSGRNEDRPATGVDHGYGAERLEIGDPSLATVAAIPAYNESLSIASVVHQAREHVDLVLVLDDGSDDDTAEIARQAGARVLTHVVNQGKAQAIRTLFDWALEREVEHLVLLDGDGQHDPRQIPRMLKPIRAGEAEVSLGFRFGADTEMPFYRRIGKRVLDYATALGTGGEATDSQCGFRAFSREAMQRIELREDGFAVESEMVVSAKENNLAMTEVPITCRYEDIDNASTEDPVSHGVGVLEQTIHLVTERRPLMFMGVPAFALVTAGVGLGTWVVWTLKMTGQFAVGTALLTSMMVLGGTFLGLTAVLLHVIPNTLTKHLGKEAQYEVTDSGPVADTEGRTNGANGHTNGKAKANGHENSHANGQADRNGHESGHASEHARPLDEAQSRLPRPRPPEEIPDWTEPTDKETPSEVDR